ncbi:MAG: tRNA (adenosine(37)-N6)-threonylcarbamoyltransferase complex dimerization subunit type 1 TsaB [Solirubrobacterales bacterium]
MSVVLGFDTATAFVTVAVADGDDVLAAAEHGPDEAGRPRASELLLAEVERLVADAGGWERIGRIAVGIGPGSFTGLRIGIATARGLAQGRELPIAGVTTVDALARGIREAHPGRAALAVLDARRREAFAAQYEEGGERSWGPAVLDPDELAERAAGLDPPPLAAGDGSVRFREQLEAAGVNVADSEDPVHRVVARHVCALGSEQPAGAPAAIEPLYLRVPDADRWQRR